MDILSRPIPSADHRIPYGSGPCQFGDLWLPQPRGPGLLPLVVFFHGGWWKSEYDLGYAGHLCAALKKEGIATWSVEYRSVGETGGGWPATFQDAAAGFDYAATLAKSYPLDLSRVITHGPFGRRPSRVLGCGQASHPGQQRDLSTAAEGCAAGDDCPCGRSRSAIDHRSVGIFHLCARQA